MKKQILTIITTITIGLGLNAQDITDSLKKAKIAAPTSMVINSTLLDELRLQTGGIDRLTLLKNGNISINEKLGIGTYSPDTKLHVLNGSAGAVSTPLATVAAFESSSAALISILTPATANAGLNFLSPAGIANQGFIAYNHSNNMLRFATNNSDKMIITGSGDIGIGTPTPNAKLHVMGTTSISLPPLTGTIATFENNSGAFLSINAGTAAQTGVNFGNPSDNSAGFINYTNSSNDLRIGAGSTTRILVDGPTGNVGLGTTTPDAKLDVNGDFALSKKILLTGNGGHANYDRLGASVIAIETPANGGGGETISGIANGVDGLIIHLYPVTGTSLTLLNESASSLAANRILTQSANTISFTNNGGCTLIYDGNAQRWRVIGIAN